VLSGYGSCISLKKIESAQQKPPQVRGQFFILIEVTPLAHNFVESSVYSSMYF